MIGSWHPMTSYASVRLVECPNNRGQEWSCIPVAFCNTLRPRSNRQYCRWDGTEPFVCCPQQPFLSMVQPSKYSRTRSNRQYCRWDCTEAFMWQREASNKNSSK